MVGFPDLGFPQQLQQNVGSSLSPHVGSFNATSCCKWICTTVYHPITNGIIECFHHQLKSSLKSYPNPTNWSDILPIILLGIHTTLKDDVHCTAAELVYGTTLRFLGEFLIQVWQQMLSLIHVTMSLDSEQQCNSSRQSRPGSIKTKLLLVVICWTVLTLLFIKI